MQKALKILEQNAEWIAMGLGGLWVLLIVWKYVLTPPVVSLGKGTTLHPSEVDLEVSHAATALANEMNRKDVPKMPGIDFAEQFAKSMESTMPMPLAFAPIDSPAASKPLVVGPGGDVPNGPTLLAALPGPLVPTDASLIAGRSMIVKPVPAANANNNGAVPAPAVPVAPVPLVNPVGGAPIVPINGVDKVWVTVFGLVDYASWDTLFKEAKLPDWLGGQKEFLEVQIERQEVGPDGTPVGQPVRVKPVTLNEPAADWKTDPDQFLDWADKNQVPIIQPVFYQVVSGDMWKTPEMAAAEAANPANLNGQTSTPWLGPDGTFNAKQFLDATKAMTPKDALDARLKLTPEQRREVTKEEQDEKDKDRTNHPPTVRPGTGRPNTDTRGGGVRGGGGGVRGGGVRGGNDITDPSIFREILAQAAPGNVAPIHGRPNAGGRRPLPTGPGPYQGGFQPRPEFQQAGAVNQDPNGKIHIWAHDDSVESGKTYVYRIRVIYKNPVYKTQNIAQPALTQQLGIPDFADPAAGWSEWSKPVTIPQLINFWLASNVGANTNAVRFRVRKWQNAKANDKEFTVQVGDMIGGLDKATGVDYSTGWILDDARPISANDCRATLANESSSQIMTRTYRADDADLRQHPLPPPAVGAGLGRAD
jgi:hypothetical protein